MFWRKNSKPGFGRRERQYNAESKMEEKCINAVFTLIHEYFDLLKCVKNAKISTVREVPIG